jgi:hypothetical protein
VSAYRRAIDAATHIIERRAKYYRNLVVGVVLLGLASVGGALWLQTLPPLSFALLLIPCCGLFYYLDAALVSGWRSRLLTDWERGEIDLSALLEALRATPTLPKETLIAMLRSLPIATTLQIERTVPLKSRNAVAALIKAIHSARADLLALRIVASFVAVVAAIGAILLKTWYFLACIAIMLPLPLLARWAKRVRLRRALGEVFIARLDPSFSDAACERLALELDCQPFVAAEIGLFVAAIRRDARGGDRG